MVLELIVCAIAAGLAVTGSLTFWPIHHGYDFYIPIVLAIAGYILGIIFIFCLVYLFGLPVKNKKDVKRSLRWSRFWLTQGMSFINHHALILVKFIGKEKIPQNQRFLLVCNHRSNFDPLVTAPKLVKHDVAFITKQSNMKIPLANNFFNSVLYIGVDRSDLMQSLQAMKKATDIIMNDSASIAVYPEGTRQQKEIIGEFHEGVFNIAIKAHCPIVVMTCKNSDKVHKRFPWRFTRVIQEVIAVIPPEEFDTLPAKTVSENVRQLMIENLSK